MTPFTFDTSGAVGPVFDARTNLLYRHLVRFPDLSPFMQGYVRASFGFAPIKGFSDLAPATRRR